MAAPKSPDPYQTANAQTNQNIATATANSVIGNANETSPYGSVNYRQIGSVNVNGQAVPQFSRTVSLSPTQQRLYDQSMQLGEGMNNLAIGQVNNLQNVLGQPLNTRGLPDAVNSVQLQQLSGRDYEQSRRRVEDAMYSRLAPQLSRDRAALDARLANQGVTSGSEAYREAQAQADRQSTDARMQVILAGGQEQSRLAGLDQARTGFNNNATLQAADFANTARGRSLQELLAERNQPINEISALRSGGQVTAPQFANYRGGQVAGTDLAGLINADANRQQSQYNAMLGGAASLAGTVMGLPMAGGASSTGQAIAGGSVGGNLLGGLMR